MVDNTEAEAQGPIRQELGGQTIGLGEGSNYEEQRREKHVGKGHRSGEQTLQYTFGPKALAKTDIMKTDFTVAEEMHRRTNQSSIESEGNRTGTLVSWKTIN